MSEASTTLKLCRVSKKIISSLFLSHKYLKFKAVLWNNKNLKQWSLNIWLNTLFIRTFIQSLRSVRSVLVNWVEKSNNWNKNGEALSTFVLKRVRNYNPSTTPVESLRIQLLIEGTWAFLSFYTQRYLTVGKIAF